MTASKTRAPRWIATALFFSVLIAFRSTTGFEFLPFWDDAAYVTQNPQVLAGITWEGTRWAFTQLHIGNWHPLTWLSHMADVEFWGRAAGAHHRTNLIVHATNAALAFTALFGLLRGKRARRTQAWSDGSLLAICAFTTLLFALHPLRAESVAWVSERKGLLAGSFFFLTLIAYTRYAEQPTRAAYFGVCVALLAGLLAKPILVSVPLLLLCLDVWPLERHRSHAWKTLALEKLPLLALCIAVAAVAFAAQLRADAAPSLDQVSLGARLATSIMAAAFYLQKTLLPTDLAAFYPYPTLVYGAAEWGSRTVVSTLSLLGIAGVAYALRRRHPALWVGLAWYLVLLFPVSGVVRVGAQAAADRYTYLPLIGPVLAVVWLAAAGVRALQQRGSRFAPAIAVAVACATLVPLASLARRQVETWHNSETLWTHAHRVVPHNYRASVFLGMLALGDGRDSDALAYFREAEGIAPGVPLVAAQLGIYFMRERDYAAARPYLERAVLGFPEHGQIQFGLGVIALDDRNWEEALVRLRKAVALEPGNSVYARTLEQVESAVRGPGAP